MPFSVAFFQFIKILFPSNCHQFGSNKLIKKLSTGLAVSYVNNGQVRRMTKQKKGINLKQYGEPLCRLSFWMLSTESFGLWWSQVENEGEEKCLTLESNTFNETFNYNEVYPRNFMGNFQNWELRKINSVKKVRES